MHLFKDILNFLGNLTFIDYVFFFAVLVLIILIVTLFYFIKINDEVFTSKSKEDKKEPTQEMKIIEEINKALNNNESKENTYAENAIDSYEKDQEERAIISYDELLKQDHNYELNYEKEEYLDDLSVKKVNLDNLVTEKEMEEKPIISGRVISFAKEEAFLKALKQLQKELN